MFDQSIFVFKTAKCSVSLTDQFGDRQKRIISYSVKLADSSGLAIAKDGALDNCKWTIGIYEGQILNEVLANENKSIGLIRYSDDVDDGEECSAILGVKPDIFNNLWKIAVAGRIPEKIRITVRHPGDWHLDNLNEKTWDIAGDESLHIVDFGAGFDLATNTFEMTAEELSDIGIYPKRLSDSSPVSLGEFKKLQESINDWFKYFYYLGAVIAFLLAYQVIAS